MFHCKISKRGKTPARIICGPGLSVQFSSELAGKPEDNNLARRQGDCFIGLGVTSFTSIFVVSFKFTESADQHGMIFFHGLLHDVEDGFNQFLDLSSVPVSLFVDVVNNAGFSKGVSASHFLSSVVPGPVGRGGGFNVNREGKMPGTAIQVKGVIVEDKLVLIYPIIIFSIFWARTFASSILSYSL